MLSIIAIALPSQHLGCITTTSRLRLKCDVCFLPGQLLSFTREQEHAYMPKMFCAPLQQAANTGLESWLEPLGTLLTKVQN